MNLYIKYSTKTYQWLCFKHATMEAMRGEDVEAEVIDAYEMEMSGDTCRLCAMKWAYNENAMSEWYENYLQGIEERENEQ